MLSQEQRRSERYARTKYFLSKSGLLSITNKTAELLKKNKQLQEELDTLKVQTESLVREVMANPSNSQLRQSGAPAPGRGPASADPSAVVSSQQPSSSQITGLGSTVGSHHENSSDFTSILSGIYDFELPSVILAPVAVEPMTLPCTTAADLHASLNSNFPPNPHHGDLNSEQQGEHHVPSPRKKRPKLQHTD